MLIIKPAALPSATVLLIAALTAAACSSAAQKPAVLGASRSPAPMRGGSAPGVTSSAVDTGWVAIPSSIAMPAGVDFQWDYAASGEAEIDQAVQAVQDINRGEVAGVGSNPQNTDIIPFAKYATGQTLAWIDATFADYRRNDGTWTGSVRYYDVTTSDFRGSGAGESGIVQYCADGTRMQDVARSSGTKTSEGSDNFVLFTMKITAVDGGWQAGNLTIVTKDRACAG